MPDALIRAACGQPLLLAPFATPDIITSLSRGLTGELGDTLNEVSSGFVAGLKNIFRPEARTSDTRPHPLSPAALAGRAEDSAPLWDSQDGRLAIIDIRGPLYDRAYYCGDQLWRDGYDRIVAAVGQAQAEPDIDGVLLKLNTPGGLVTGCFEAVRQIRTLRQAGGKPVWAMVSDCACSAGYALASACETVIASETALTGSIGVLITLSQYTGLHEKLGLKTLAVHFGDYKIDGAGFKEITEDEIARLQTMIDELGRVFVAHVAEGRSLDPADVMAQQAGLYTGGQALPVGLVDAIATTSEALDALKDLAAQRDAGSTNRQ